MPTVAQKLRQAREAQSLTIEDVAELTKLRTDHVRALESGSYSVFSGKVYVRGFTKTFAKALKLDPDPLLEELESEFQEKRSGTKQVSNNALSKGFVEIAALYLSRINWKIVLPILIFFVLIAMGSLGVRVWQYQQTRDPLEDLGDGRYENDQPLPSAYLPLPDSVSQER